jgi:hypothetical protein
MGNPLTTSDSVRQATRRLLATLPREASSVKVLARPPVLFYILDRVAFQRVADRHGLGQPGSRREWALVDESQLRQEGDPDQIMAELRRSWEVVDSWPTTLSLPTRLDDDPGIIRHVRTDRTSSERPANLWLLRSRLAGGP